MIVVSVNLSPIIAVTAKNGKRVETAIFKKPAAGPVNVGTRGIVGDDQADKRHHGHPTQALYAFSAQEYAHWRGVKNKPFPYGLFGENLTIDGLDDSLVCLGDRYRIGSVSVEVTFPRLPCSTLAMAVEDTSIVAGFLERKRVGPYLRVLSEGTLAAGDSVNIESSHPARLSIVECMYLLHDAEGTPRDLERWRDLSEIDAADDRVKEKALAKLASA
jgi:MOSC domain-containing protein YiiM